MNKTVLTVDVTRNLINSAIRKDARKCAIADAITASDPDIAWANVDRDFIQFGRESDGLRYKYRTPRAAKIFVSDFDNGRSPKPFKLIIEQSDLVQIRPRQLQQTQTSVQVDQRRYVASHTNRRLRDVTLDDVKVYERETGDSTVFANVGTGQARDKGRGHQKASATKSRTATTGTPRPYAKRPTLRDVLAAAGELV